MSILQIDEAVPMLQSIKPDAGPCCQLVFHKPFIFNFEPVPDDDIST